MSAVVTLAYVPALLLAAFGLAIVACRRADAREEQRQHDAAEAEQQQIDRVFLNIVTTQLADLEVRRPDGQ